MSAISTAKRRRRQAANNYRHIAKLGRPIYKKRSADKLQARLMRLIEKQRTIALNKGKSKK